MTFPQTILPIRAEILLGTTWTDITHYVRIGDGGSIEITRGTPNEGTSPEPATMNLMLNNRDGRFSPRNPTGPYYGQIGRNTPIRVSITGSSFVQITGLTGNTIGTASFSTPDSAATSLTGNLDIRFDADLVSWRDDMMLYGKTTKTGNQASYRLSQRFTGQLQFFWSPDGTDASTLSTSSSVPVPVTNGRLAVRIAFVANNGAGGSTATFYTSDSLSGTWTQLGDVKTFAGTTSIFDSTSPTYVLDGPDDGFGSIIHGRVYGAELRNASNVVVANPIFTGLAANTTSFADTSSNTWTLNSSLGALVVVDADPRFIGEVSAWPQMWDGSDRDVWVPLESADIRRRLNQGDQPLQSTLRIALAEEPSLQAYWPAEDGDSATAVATALIGGNTMRVQSGTADFASDSSFIGSMSILQCNGASLYGAVPTYTSTGTIQVRFLLHIPTGGTVNGSSIMRVNTNGAIATWALTYGTGGTLTLTARDAQDTVISAVFSNVAFSMNGRLTYVSMEFINSGTACGWRVETIDATSTAAGFVSGSLAANTVGRCTSLRINNGLSMLDVGMGHFTVESAKTDLFTVGVGPLQGYAGETAQTRMLRLSAAQGVNFQAGGFSSGSTLMGPQGTETYLDLMQECADVDGGILFTPKDWLALAYRPAVALYGQPADVTLDYSQHQMSSLQPTEDDTNLFNDVTVSRPGGSAYRVTDTTSRLSVNAPPLGVGTYSESLTLNVFSDNQLDDQAGWRVRAGTVDEARYPTIDLDLASPGVINSGKSAAINALDIGARLVVINPPSWIPPDAISQLIRGYTEELAQYTHTFALNCTPSSPFDTAGVYGISYAASRYSSDGSTISAATSTATSLTVATPSGPLWTHADGDFDILVGGERMTVTNVTGTTSPQTFTVIRSVNGVVKAQAASTALTLFAPAYYVL